MRKIIYILLTAGIIVSCSTTSSLEPDQQLYVGMEKIDYLDPQSDEHYKNTLIELESALATAPNGALFGSPYYRTPFPYGLWIWNALQDKNGAVAKWINSNFGKGPVLMGNVNPELRVSIAESVLRNHGYFGAKVGYDVYYGKPKVTKNDSVPRPRTAKIQYNAKFGHLYTLDSISYCNFPVETKPLMTEESSLLKKGNAFDVSQLDAERTRIYNLLRNHGYYYYQKSYTSYLADTLQKPGQVQLQVYYADSLPEEANKRWIIGKTEVRIRRQMFETITDSIQRRYLTIRFAGNRPPVRPSIILADNKLRPGMLFSQDIYQESLDNLHNKGIFSSVDFTFTPHRNADSTLTILPDTVSSSTRGGEDRSGSAIFDMAINCVLDKPYDFTLHANYISKSSGRTGPGLGFSFAKRNAFRGAELLTVNGAVNYEFQVGGAHSSLSDSYQLTGDVALELPRLVMPKFILGSKRRRWETTPSTTLRLAGEIVTRSGYFRRNILTGEMSYTFQPTKQSRHMFSPLSISYDKLAETTEEYRIKLQTSPALLMSSQDYVMTKMRYSYTYTSPHNYRNPVYVSATVTESSNLLALGFMACGNDWAERDKTFFAAPFAQFLKLEGEWTKTWNVSEYSSFLAHARMGMMFTYGNTLYAPYSESFYTGGPNSIRAFSARSIGPGSQYNSDSKFAAITNIGDMQLVMNLEYRPRLFGSLYGAIFLDAGNVWNIRNYEDKNIDGNDGRFRLKNFFSDLAVGTGVGLRYDLGFFVVRLDWGFAIHTPYETSASGYFNTPDFAHGQCINFAIGYPF